jgi:hypothetical protein
MANVREQLAAMGETISDEDYTDILLTSIPTSYDQSCTSIDDSTRLSGRPLTADEAMILDEFTQREIKKQCSDCNKRGHVKVDC